MGRIWLVFQVVCSDAAARLAKIANVGDIVDCCRSRPVYSPHATRRRRRDPPGDGQKLSTDGCRRTSQLADGKEHQPGRRSSQGCSRTQRDLAFLRLEAAAVCWLREHISTYGAMVRRRKISGGARTDNRPSRSATTTTAYRLAGRSASRDFIRAPGSDRLGAVHALTGRVTRTTALADGRHFLSRDRGRRNGARS